MHMHMSIFFTPVRGL